MLKHKMSQSVKLKGLCSDAKVWGLCLAYVIGSMPVNVAQTITHCVRPMGKFVGMGQK